MQKGGTMQPGDLRIRVDQVRDRIARAAARAGRDPADVTLVAVSKTHPAAMVEAALATGLTDFGENRIQEASVKIPEVRSDGDVRWHLIGHLQRNKAQRAVELFDLVHSLDSLRLAETLDRHTAASGRRLPVLLQINIAGESQKDGWDLPGGVANASALDPFLREVEQVLALEHLEVRGLMTIAPLAQEAEQARPVFEALRELRDDLLRRYPANEWRDLSMGMTGDFEIAIEEGATLVRVGRAIFGEREALPSS